MFMGLFLFTPGSMNILFGDFFKDFVLGRFEGGYNYFGACLGRPPRGTRRKLKGNIKDL